jgi:DNA-binding NtrC family response regulator
VRTAHLDRRSEAGLNEPVPVLYVPGARERGAVRDRLVRVGAEVALAADAADALHLLGTRRFAAAVVDLANERVAMAAIRLIRAQFPSLPVIALVDSAQPLAAAEAIHSGVTDLLPWHFDDRDAGAVFAAARDAMAVDPAAGRADLTERIFEHSSAMRMAVEAMKGAASRKTSVLITGESGSGRQLVARTVHERDHEFVSRALVAVDCAEDPNQLERVLFGAAGDRLTDVTKASATERVCRGGAILAAQGGTLVLRNVIDAPARVQARLARVLRDREVHSTDLNEAIVLDLRVVGVVGPDVDAAVADGRLRRDLFERLGQVRIDVPPLRRRREDIPMLAAHFLRRSAEGSARRFSRGALALLSALPWPGNAGELKRVIDAMVSASRRAVLQIEDVLAQANLDSSASPAVPLGGTLRDARARFERECISAALIRHHGRAGDAAKALGIQRTNLYRKVRQLNVSRALLSNRK